MSTRDRRRGERGVTAVLVAGVLALLLAMLGLSMSVGHVLATRGENQNAVDSSALAGAMWLDGHQSGIDAAGDASRNFALAHRTDSNDAEPVQVDDASGGTVEFGHWDRGTRQWERVTTRDQASLLRIQAVRAVAAPRNQEAWFLNVAGGRTSAPIGAEAIAVGGGSATFPNPELALPFVVNEDCMTNRCTRPRTDPPYDDGYYYVDVGSTWNQSAGATSLDENTPGSMPVFCDILDNGTSHQVATCDVIRTQNGSDPVRENCAGTGTGCEKLAERVGQTAYIPVIRYSDTCDGTTTRTSCGAPYNGPSFVQGFMTVRIAFVECRGNRPEDAVIAEDAGHDAAWFRTQCYSDMGYPAKSPTGGWYCVAVQVRCNEQPPTGEPGGGFYGTFASYSWLVR